MEHKEEIIRLAKEMSEKLPILKTAEDLKALTETLTKLTVERALNAELGYIIWKQKTRLTAAMAIVVRLWATNTGYLSCNVVCCC